MNFNENLKMLLISKKLKQADLCRMTGIQTSLMSDYLGGKKSPTIGNAIIIADALDISLDTLVGKETYTTEEKQESHNGDFDKLLQSYNLLNDEGQKKALETVSDLTQIPKYQKRPEIKNIRLNNQTDDNEITLTVAARGGGVTTVKTTKEALDELTSLEPENDIDL